MSHKRFQAYFFIILLFASGVLTLLVFRPYFMALAFGGVLAVVFRPLHRFLRRLLRSGMAAALLTTITAALILVLPSVYFFAALYSEISDSFGHWGSGSLDIASWQHRLQGTLPAGWQQPLARLLGESAGLVQLMNERLAGNFFGLFSNVLVFVIGFIVTLGALYYLLRDGAEIKTALLALSPLNDAYDELVLQKVVLAAGAVVNGFVVIGLVKGFFAAVCFWAVGLPTPFFWGALTGLAWFLPLVGSAVVMIPAAGYMFLTGHPVAAVIILAVAFLVVHPVDGILQPLLVGARTRMHPLLALLAVFGGVEFYGFSGFIFGPLTVAVTLALIDIYKKDFRCRLEKP